MRTLLGSSRFLVGASALLLSLAVASCALLGGVPAPRTGDASLAASLEASLAASELAWATPTGAGSSVTPGVPGSSEAATADATPGATVTRGPAGPTPAATTTATAAGPTPTRTAGPSPTPAPTSSGPCYIFPSSNVWNRDISHLAVASNSAAMINAIGRNDYLHPDFDAIGDGIPYNLVTPATTYYNFSFQYADESDPGPYPIPANARIEKGSDRHLLAIDLTQCKLWELYAARRVGSTWTAGSGAVYDLRSNALRPAGWTSADAAGLPIFPGLVRYEEVMAGAIYHAIRFTAPDTCGYIYPARHLTADPCSNLPPMGLRLRLKASVDISGFGPHAQVVLKALKRYGMILADNGSPWYISGVPDNRWDDDEFHKLQTLFGSDFEVVDTSGLRNG